MNNSAEGISLKYPHHLSQASGSSILENGPLIFGNFNVDKYSQLLVNN